MATPTKHAICSASSSDRWLHCTAAPRYEMQFPDKGSSPFAIEGTIAHAVCEQAAMYNFGQITKRKYNSQIKKLKEQEQFNEEMLKTAEFYAQYLYEKAMEFAKKPYTTQEVRVDFSEYVPEGFGTCDSVMIGGDTLCITDYKHGKGVQVSAEKNSQMRLYALGALKRYSFIYPDITKVSMAIVQPRITEDVSEECITVEELLAWGEEIKPLAEQAYSGPGEFHAGSWCRFCKGKAQCKARAENYTALEDFKDAIPVGKLQGSALTAYVLNGDRDGVLEDAQVADLLIRGAELVSWYNDLKEYALDAILSGKEIPGWKVVAGRSMRSFIDADKAMETIKAAGWDEAMLYERKPKSLAELEKMIGKKPFAELLADQIQKPLGKPTLVDQSDKREPYSTAVADFGGATQ